MFSARILVTAFTPAAMPFEERARAARFAGRACAWVECVSTRFDVMLAALMDGDALAANRLERELFRNHP
jgi:hypothetical protein